MSFTVSGTASDVNYFNGTFTGSHTQQGNVTIIINSGVTLLSAPIKAVGLVLDPLTYNGNGFRILIRTLNAAGTRISGLFGLTNDINVVNFTNVDLQIDTVNTFGRIVPASSRGLLLGEQRSTGTINITNCTVRNLQGGFPVYNIGESGQASTNSGLLVGPYNGFGSPILNITNTSVTGVVIAQNGANSHSNVSGFVGPNSGTNGRTVAITGCTFNGTVSLNTGTAYVGNGSANGGTVTITNCALNATISGSNSFGYFSNNCATTTDSTIDILNSTFTGTISGSNSSAYIGSNCCTANGAEITLTSCTGNGNISGTSSSAFIGESCATSGGIITITGCSHTGNISANNISAYLANGCCTSGSVITIENSNYTGTITNATGSSGFISTNCCNAATINITGCISNSTFSSTVSGGSFIGNSNFTNNSTLNMTGCTTNVVFTGLATASQMSCVMGNSNFSGSSIANLENVAINNFSRAVSLGNDPQSHIVCATNNFVGSGNVLNCTGLLIGLVDQVRSNTAILFGVGSFQFSTCNLINTFMNEIGGVNIESPFIAGTNTLIDCTLTIDGFVHNKIFNGSNAGLTENNITYFRDTGIPGSPPLSRSIITINNYTITVDYTNTNLGTPSNGVEYIFFGNSGTDFVSLNMNTWNILLFGGINVVQIFGASSFQRDAVASVPTLQINGFSMTANSLLSSYPTTNGCMVSSSAFQSQDGMIFDMQNFLFNIGSPTNVFYPLILGSQSFTGVDDVQILLKNGNITLTGQHQPIIFHGNSRVNITYNVNTLDINATAATFTDETALLMTLSNGNSSANGSASIKNTTITTQLVGLNQAPFTRTLQIPTTIINCSSVISNITGTGTGGVSHNGGTETSLALLDIINTNVLCTTDVNADNFGGFMAAESITFNILNCSFRGTNFNGNNNGGIVGFRTENNDNPIYTCLLYTSPSPRDED